MSELVSMRIAYGQALVEVGRKYPDVVVLSADVANSDHSYLFQESFPDRFINVGIAEQCLVDAAAGLAYAGKIPIANTFAFLFATRALEMIRTHLCYGSANVKLMGAYAGLSDSFDGPTHHSINDVAVLRSLPNMTVLVPSDAVCLTKLMPQAVEWPGPVYMRLNRNEVPVLFDERYEPRIGKAVRLRTGKDVTLVSNGLMVSRCLEAADRLRQAGIQAEVLEMHTVKPLDSETLLESAKETHALVTVEEHSEIGGLGGAVAEAVSGICPVPILRVGVPDCFAESGPYSEVLDRFGLSIERIVGMAQQAIQRKSSGRFLHDRGAP
ncbi:MAG: transketolase family protein [Acidobacteria bacterium]|nr:transketolase family protein [Acidobacteriota bacterium]